MLVFTGEFPDSSFSGSWGGVTDAGLEIYSTN